MMKRFFFLAILFTGCSVFSPLQKGKVISLYHLIETEKFEDAKIAAEKMIEDEEASQWAATWMARGYLCQTAYKNGMDNNNSNLYALYPDQLYVAWDSYERALEIDPKERLKRQLAPKYVLLANDLQKLGMANLTDRKYSDALRAFEKAMEIEKIPFLDLQQDTVLLYNAALAAYESRKWPIAIRYFEKLHDAGYSQNATHLLFRSLMVQGDTTAAEDVLFEGIEAYDDHENLVILLARFLMDQSREQEAIAVIDRGIDENPVNALLFYNKGLVFQMSNNYQQAIEAYKMAVDLDPDYLMAYANIATCYYNIGVTYEENTLRLTNNRKVKEKRKKSEKAFESALIWLDATVAKKPEDIWIIERISQLYHQLGKPDKTRGLMLNME